MRTLSEKNLVNSFPDHEIEVKMRAPRKQERSTTADNIILLVRGDPRFELWNGLDNLGMPRIITEGIYHYMIDGNGRKFGKIVHRLDRTPETFTAKRKSKLDAPPLKEKKGRRTRAERTGPVDRTLADAQTRLGWWANEAGLILNPGPSLHIHKEKIGVYCINSGRFLQVVVDESHPNGLRVQRPLRQIEVEYKGQTKKHPDDDMDAAIRDIEELTGLIRTSMQGVTHSDMSKFRWLGRSHS